MSKTYEVTMTFRFEFTPDPEDVQDSIDLMDLVLQAGQGFLSSKDHPSEIHINEKGERIGVFFHGEPIQPDQVQVREILSLVKLSGPERAFHI